MNISCDAQCLWDTLSDRYPRQVRLTLEQLLTAFQVALPHRSDDAEGRSALAGMLAEFAAAGLLRLPRATSRAAYNCAERTPLPRHVYRLNPSPRTRSGPGLWRPELAFALQMDESWHAELKVVQEWLRRGGMQAPLVAMRERSVEIFGDEKRLDALLGTNLFAPGRLSLELLRCYLPSVPIHVVSAALAKSDAPLLVVENHTTFDTLCRWNAGRKRYSAVAFGAGTAFVASAASLRVHLGKPGCSGCVCYFGDVDPRGLWIPRRAAMESGIDVKPDTELYLLLLSKARQQHNLPRSRFRFDPQLLEWLPAAVRADTTSYFEQGVRLPQELITIHDLPEERIK